MANKKKRMHIAVPDIIKKALAVLQELDEADYVVAVKGRNSSVLKDGDSFFLPGKSEDLKHVIAKLTSMAR